MILAILGRQPRLGLVELESLLGAAKVTSIGDSAALVDGDIQLARLGGSLKLAKVLTELTTTNWTEICEYLTSRLPEHLGLLPEGKLKLGLSVYGLKVTKEQLFRAGLELKKVCRANKRSVRIVPNTSTALNSAQVIHNQLTSPLGWELILVRHNNKTILAQTTAVQDVDDYARRDYGRPNRDAFVGMLPPKLAQQMLNLAGAQPNETILDPFCGTGVVLQEAALQGCRVYGTDLNEKMVRFTRDNLVWLKETYNINFDVFYEVGDATNATWRPPIDHVVCETYLGQPLSGLPKPDKLAEIMGNCNKITELFLKNIRPQLKPGSRHCLAVPTWFTGHTFKHLPALDHLESLGYNRVRFEYAASRSDLVYHRSDQIVGRELLVITVKE